MSTRTLFELVGVCPNCLRSHLRLEQSTEHGVLLLAHTGGRGDSCPGSGKHPLTILPATEINIHRFTVDSRVTVKLPFDLAVELGEIILSNRKAHPVMASLGFQLRNLENNDAEIVAEEPEPPPVISEDEHADARDELEHIKGSD